MISKDRIFDKEKFRERLISLREESGITQQMLAFDLGISRTTYAHYEQGSHEPPIENLVKLSKIYDVTVDYLLGLTDEY